MAIPDLVRVGLVVVVVVAVVALVVVVVVVVAVGLRVSFATVVIIASISAVVVVGFGGSAGLKRSNGIGIVMPGNTVIPALAGVRFATVVVVVVFAFVVVGTSFPIVVVVVRTSFAVVMVVGATTAAAMVVLDFGGSAGLNRSSGLGIVIPGKTVMPDLAGVGLSVVVVVLGVGFKDRVVTIAAS